MVHSKLYVVVYMFSVVRHQLGQIHILELVPCEEIVLFCSVTASNNPLTSFLRH